MLFLVVDLLRVDHIPLHHLLVLIVFVVYIIQWNSLKVIMGVAVRIWEQILLSVVKSILMLRNLNGIVKIRKVMEAV